MTELLEQAKKALVGIYKELKLLRVAVEMRNVKDGVQTTVTPSPTKESQQ